MLLSAPEGTERHESPLVVSLLGEVAEVLSPPRRQKLQETVLKKCHDHLLCPTSAMTAALLHLLVFKLSTTGKSRVESIRRLCLLVTECCSTEQQLDADDDEEEDEEDDEEREGRDITTYTLVTKLSAATAINALVGMLDKMCGEMDTLLKLSIRTAKIAKATAAATTTATATTTTSSSTLSSHHMSGKLTGTGAGTSDMINVMWGGEKEDMMHTCTANAVNEKEGHMEKWYANDAICTRLKVCMDIAVHFLSFKSSGAVCHALLALFLKLIKLQVRITKVVCGSPAAERANVTTSPQYLSFR